MSDTLLQLEGVHTHIGQYHILQGVDLTVPRGALTVLLGRNGAGKTTTLRTIMGLWQRSRGRITFDGRDIGGLATPDIAQGGVAYVPETMAVFSDLTVAENMRLAARHAPPDPARLDWIFGFFPALRKFWHFPAGVLSGGQKQMLSIARAVVEPRSLILVDHDPAGGAEFPFCRGPRRPRGRDGRRPDRAHRHDGGACGRHGTADAPARPVARHASVGMVR
jgi:branched-chain amino acid transport system ATP-binding protein